MPKLNQKGFSVIAFVLLVLLISIGIVIGSYYISKVKKFNGHLNQQNSSTSLYWPQYLSNSVLFLSKDRVLSLATPDGKDIRPFIQPNDQKITLKIDSGTGSPTILSPDLSKLLLSVGVSYDASNPNDPDYKIGNGQAHYIVSNEGKILKKIDLQKMNIFGEKYLIYFLGWTSDSNKLLFKAETTAEDYYDRTQIVGEYDVNSSEVKELYRRKAPPIYILFYDPMKSILAFYEDHTWQTNGKNLGYIVNLETKSKQQFSPPNVSNDFQKNDIDNPYFVTSEADFSSQERKTLYIYSYNEPNKLLAQINLDEPSGSYINFLDWSPSHSYFAVAVNQYKSLNSSQILTDRILKIYSRDGEACTE